GDSGSNNGCAVAAGAAPPCKCSFMVTSRSDAILRSVFSGSGNDRGFPFSARTSLAEILKTFVRPSCAPLNGTAEKPPSSSLRAPCEMMAVSVKSVARFVNSYDDRYPDEFRCIGLARCLLQPLEQPSPPIRRSRRRKNNRDHDVTA